MKQANKPGCSIHKEEDLQGALEHVATQHEHTIHFQRTYGHAGRQLLGLGHLFLVACVKEDTHVHVPIPRMGEQGARQSGLLEVLLGRRYAVRETGQGDTHILRAQPHSKGEKTHSLSFQDGKGSTHSVSPLAAHRKEE